MPVRVVSGVFDPQAEAAAFVQNNSGFGALVSFTGYCRSENDGNPVSALELHYYPGFTEKEISRLTNEIRGRYNCLEILVIHRVGKILPGDAIVLVAALAKHRAEAFNAAEVLMDYLKTDAPLWKKEIGSDNTAHWIEPREDDHARRMKHGRTA